MYILYTVYIRFLRLAKSVEGFLDSADLNSSRVTLKRANLLVEVSRR